MAYQFVFMKTDFVRRLKDGAIIPIDSDTEAARGYRSWVAQGNLPLPWDYNPDLELYRANKLLGLNNSYEKMTGVLETRSPVNEQKSWPIQIAEARSLLSDASADIPWIKAAAAQRGMTELELANRIVAKHAAYWQRHGELTGIRQRVEKQITQCTCIDDLQAIDVDAIWHVQNQLPEI